MEVLIPAFVIIALVMAGMAVGVILSNKPIAGTCGGLGNMRDEHGMPMCECGPGREASVPATTFQGRYSFLRFPPSLFRSPQFFCQRRFFCVSAVCSAAIITVKQAPI